MKPILYAGDETTFASNGLGRLSDCVFCEATEERNGMFECRFKYPVSGPMYKLIREGNIIGVIHDDAHDIQPFDIYGHSAPINGIVTFYARHISYRLRNVILKPFTATSCADALSKFKTQTYNSNPFTFWTDKTVNGEFKNEIPASCRSLLAGQEGSILDVYGTGEYKFDKFDVKLYTHRGNDNGVSIRYGVNMTDITHDVDHSNVYSAVAPYWKSTEDGHVVTLPEGYVVAQNAPVQLFPWTTDTDAYMTHESGEIYDFAIAQIILVPLDLSDKFDEEPTISQLREAARTRLNNSDAWVPNENIKVKFVDLSHTEDYKNMAVLQRVSLCDRVSVYCGPIGVEAASMQVVRVVYDVLAESYSEIELGHIRPSYAETILTEVEQKTKELPTRKEIDTAIDHASQLITGGLGGYVIFKTNADGQPEELLIMDSPNRETAVNVWRFNKGGLGHSHNGYNGPFNDVALTSDGRINATAITTGILYATLLKAGVISAANNDQNYWNLETGEFALRSDGATDGIIYKNGRLHINASNIDVGTMTANMIKAGILQDNLGRSYWNLTTGVMSINGTLTTSYTDYDDNVRQIKLNRGEISFIENGDTYGELYTTFDYDDYNNRIKGLAISGNALGMFIQLMSSPKDQIGGSLIQLYPDGTITLDGDKICLTSSSIQVNSTTTYNGIIYVPGDGVNLGGQIVVENGLITNYIPDQPVP